MKDLNIQDLTQDFVNIYMRKLTENGVTDISLQVALIKILTETAEEWANSHKSKFKTTRGKYGSRK